MDVPWYRLRQAWQRRCLQRPEYRFLFEEPTAEWVSLDCETTSLDRHTAELLSIGAVRVQGNRILSSQPLYLLVQPVYPPAPENVRIHGLRPQDVRNALSPDVAIQQLLAFVEGRPLLGYYLEYDIAVLNRYVKPLLGIGLPQRQIEISSLYYDYKLRQNPDRYIDLRLDTLCEDLDIPVFPRHNALNDAINAAMLYLALRQRVQSH